MIETVTRNEPVDDHVDDHVDDEIATCLSIEEPRSFFLFAGAGSGKTRSLVTALDYIRATNGERLRLGRRQIGVITYTNAACDEITRRLNYDLLFSVSTIHSFVWDLIRGFNSNIRNWLDINLKEEIRELQDQTRKGRPGTKAAAERERSLKAKQKRLDGLPSIRKFLYSPTGDNRTRDLLNHAEVIKLGADFLTQKILLQNLLVDRFPILLIDESQDTNKLLMEALFSVQRAHSGRFALGLFGDTMQRIYTDGKVELGKDLPAGWATPTKAMNHRCPRRVVRLVNKVRASVDGQVQRPRTDAREGTVRLYIALNNADKVVAERCVRTSMAERTADPLWNRVDQVKTLILEHHMAATRLMFFDMFQPLYQVDSFRTGLLDGSLSCVRFFSELVLPLINAKRSGSAFSAAALIRKWSPLLREDSLKKAGAYQSVQLTAANKGTNALVDTCAKELNSSFREVLQCVARHNLLDIPETLYPFSADDPPEIAGTPAGSEANEGSEALSASLGAIQTFLETPFAQIWQYTAYVKGQATFDTHQGVKGLEFPRVFVVMDDNEARGFSFSYEKLFGAKEKSKADSENEQSGNDSGIDRTRRLFYVTCSRAKESLAVIAYTSDVAKVRRHATEQGWFDENEIEILA